MSKRHVQRGTNRARQRLSVVPKPPGWAVEGFPAAQATYKTQRDAVAAARKLIDAEEGGEIIVHGRDGRIRGVDTCVVGGAGFDRISAVEGIVLDDEMKRDFRMLDRKRLSPEKRRAWLMAKYGSPRGNVRRGT